MSDESAEAFANRVHLGIELDDVRAAAGRLRSAGLHRTPLLRSRTLDEIVGAEVFLKAENLQRTGSFKLRGATNRVALLARSEDRPPGIATMSSGNHGAAVAHAATNAGLPVVVVMPLDSPANKLAATRHYGAEIITYDRYTEDREAIARAVADERGYAFIPPFDDWDVMAGQGTLALEAFEDAGPDPFDMMVVCVGGGGLIAGCATVAKALNPACRVVGAEPEASDDTARSLAAGHRVRLDAVPRTIADGQAAQEPGLLTFEVVRQRVDEIATVSEDEIVAAMRFCFERLRIVVEPSGACALAVVLSGKVEPVGRVLVTISGGNISAERFAELVGSP